jgi:hypothetical protein
MTATTWWMAGTAVAVVLVPYLATLISGYCIEATSPVSIADELLANKVLLETDERRFLATAHRFPYR